jgi:hypothetical protein
MLTPKQKHEEIAAAMDELLRKLKRYSPVNAASKAAILEFHNSYFRTLDTGPCPKCPKTPPVEDGY